MTKTYESKCAGIARQLKTTQDLARLLYNALAKGKGLSVSVDGTEPTTGYAVSVPGFEMRLVANAWDLVRQWTKWTCERIQTHNTLQQWDPADRVLGAWTDTETGHVYLDVSIIVGDDEHAKEIAELSGQLAIWDIAKGEEIRLDEACDPCDPTDCPTRVLCPHYQKTRLDDKCPGGFPVGEPCGNCDKCP